MKKNILTVVIMAATVINLVLTIVLVFSIMPAMNKTTNLIDKVASVIDLEIEDKNEEEEYTMADLDPFEISYEKAVNINLAEDANGEGGFVQIQGINISFNKKAEDYQDIKTQVTTNQVYAEDMIKKTLGSYTKDDFDMVKVSKDCVKKLQEMYNTKAIVEVIIVNPILAG